MIAAALGIVYIVWGSTYLAIRVAIETMPPFLMAGIRFLIAGGILFAFSYSRDDPVRPIHWRTGFIVGGALLLGGNGGVVWAEQRIPSGITALLIAAVPMWMGLMDRAIWGQRLRMRAAVGLIIGFGGIIALVAPTGGIAHLDLVGVGVLVFASLAWSAGSLYGRSAPLPKTPLLGASLQMIGGGALLTLAGIASGEPTRIDVGEFSARSLIAFVYLIFLGSLAGFTAYSWLLRNARISLVGTYAYVNPVVAVVLGWLILSESLGLRTLASAAVIVAGVALIVTSQDVPEIAAAASPADAPAA